jgi:demethylmenaquinone methyltransferase/2-methoxy-6-polyprenyl-1,4-benzoquinol methylase
MRSSEAGNGQLNAEPGESEETAGEVSKSYRFVQRVSIGGPGYDIDRNSVDIAYERPHFLRISMTATSAPAPESTSTPAPATKTVDKSDRRVREMFGAIAPRYDRMNHLLSMQVDRYWRWRTVRKVRPRGPAPILDLCTGTGDLALAFHRYTRGQTPIVGADFCPEMLALAEKKKPRGAEGSLTFLEADAQAIPFPENHFQAVAVAFGLRNVADTERALREMARVCRPSGRVAVLEFSMPTRQPFKAAYGWYFRRVLPRIGDWLARNEAKAYDYLPASVQEFPAGERLADMMLGAGLASVSIHPFTFGVATLYLGVK